MDVMTVADDLVELHDGRTIHRFEGLAPSTEHALAGMAVRTLPRPGGELLCRFATVNDVHFGETECGVIEGVDAGPVLTVPPGSPPYPVVMNRGAVHDITAIAPDAVIVKGDLTCSGQPEEYQAFLDCWVGAFGERLTHVRGNHDAYHGQDFAAGPHVIDLPGVRIALLDTVWPGHTTGILPADEAAWLDAVAAESDRPVIVLGHHQAWMPAEHPVRDPNYFGISPDDSERLLEVVERRRSIIGYFAGHTHRNRVCHHEATGSVPYVEVACVKDFPGSWAEYRVYEGGVLQVHHRISTPDALAWSEQCRGLYGNLLDYVDYALGTVDQHSFAIDLR